MHCYEVIPEGSVCKLYFDLEFHKPSNKEADGRAMVTSLIQVQFFPTWLLIKITVTYVWTACNNTVAFIK